jgi:cytochrome P450
MAVMDPESATPPNPYGAYTAAEGLGGIAAPLLAAAAVTLLGLALQIEADLPAGGEVIYSPAAMHRDPTVFPDPLRFDPRRWLDGAATPAMRRAFVPFSLGNRQCLGDRFAWNQMKTTLTAIVGGCRLALPDGFRARTAAEPLPGRPDR